MSVPFIHPDHRGFSTDRDDPEPPLADLLGDPTLHTLMARDGVDRPSLERLLAATQRRLSLQPAPTAAPGVEATLFAECRAAQ